MVTSIVSFGIIYLSQWIFWNSIPTIILIRHKYRLLINEYEFTNFEQKATFKQKVERSLGFYWRLSTFYSNVKEAMVHVSWSVCTVTSHRSFSDTKFITWLISTAQENTALGVIGTSSMIPCHESFRVTIMICVGSFFNWTGYCWGCYICNR